jgi:hypothetical protein
MVSLVLSAVSGGLFEIGDDLPTLGKSADRLAWLKNSDLLDMVRLGRASTPVDLLTYQKEDTQPSIFVLKESDRQTIVTVFNWTEKERSRDLPLAQLGLSEHQGYDVSEVLASTTKASKVSGTLHLAQPPHSVRLLKFVNRDSPVQKPVADILVSATGVTGVDIDFNVPDPGEYNPVIEYQWDFGGGTSTRGSHVVHAYTSPGTYAVTLMAVGLEKSTASAHTSITIAARCRRVSILRNSADYL